MLLSVTSPVCGSRSHSKPMATTTRRAGGPSPRPWAAAGGAYAALPEMRTRSQSKNAREFQPVRTETTEWDDIEMEQDIKLLSSLKAENVGGRSGKKRRRCVKPTEEEEGTDSTSSDATVVLGPYYKFDPDDESFTVANFDDDMVETKILESPIVVKKFEAAFIYGESFFPSFTHVSKQPDVDYIWAEDIATRHLHHHLGVGSCELATRNLVIDGRLLPKGLLAVVNKPVVVMIKEAHAASVREALQRRGELVRSPSLPSSQFISAPSNRSIVSPNVLISAFEEAGVSSFSIVMYGQKHQFSYFKQCKRRFSFSNLN